MAAVETPAFRPGFQTGVSFTMNVCPQKRWITPDQPCGKPSRTRCGKAPARVAQFSGEQMIKPRLTGSSSIQNECGVFPAFIPFFLNDTDITLTHTL
jgi:hypothetical protein